MTYKYLPCKWLVEVIAWTVNIWHFFSFSENFVLHNWLKILKTPVELKPEKFASYLWLSLSFYRVSKSLTEESQLWFLKLEQQLSQWCPKSAFDLMDLHIWVHYFSTQQNILNSSHLRECVAGMLLLTTCIFTDVLSFLT